MGSQAPPVGSLLRDLHIAAVMAVTTPGAAAAHGMLHDKGTYSTCHHNGGMTRLQSASFLGSLKMLVYGCHSLG